MGKTLPGYDEALARVLACAPAVGDERVGLDAAMGRVLRKAVVADRDQPPFDRSAMDGFAVRSAEVKREVWFDVVGEVVAGGTRTMREAHDAASVVRIATGAVVPVGEGFDAVVQIEKAEVQAVEGGGTCGGERVRFEVDAVKPWQNVHRQGVDAKVGDALVAPGSKLNAQHIGLAAAAGAVELTVAQRVRVVVITTGDEVMPPEVATGELEVQQIRNSNGPMLRALLGQWGAEVIEHVHVADDLERTLCVCREALSRGHMVVTVGGVSVGRRDFLPMAWEQLGLETVLHGVGIQPGKPVFVATDGCKLVVGLPGNPVSVFTSAWLFVREVLGRSVGDGGAGGIRTIREAHDAASGARGGNFRGGWRVVELGEVTKAKAGRQLFRAGVLDEDGRARVIGWQGSGDLTHLAGGDGLVRLPLVEGEVAAGTKVGWLGW